MKNLKLISFSLILFLVSFDQITKFWARENLSEYAEPLVLIPKVLGLGLVFNSGAAFGILNQQTFLLSIISFLFCLVLLIFLIKNFSKLNKTELFSLVLIFAGAFGNGIDRFYFQQVTDFIELFFIPNFNFADAFINFGFTLYLWGLLLKREKSF